MTALRKHFWRALAIVWRGSPNDAPERGRQIISAAAKRSGAPTPELKRVYGEYLAYERGFRGSQ